MLQRLRILLAIVCLLALLPSAAAAGEEGKGGAAPPKDAPKAAPGEDETPGDVTDDEEPADEPAPKTEPKDEPKKEPAIPAAEAPAPVPAGMTYLEGGRIMVGSEAQYLDALLAGRPIEHKRVFLHETPYHAVFVRPYFIGKYEVTNAQYLRFLQDSAAAYDTASGSLANLDEIAASLAHLSPDEQKNPRQVAWLQLYMANREEIWAAFGAKLDEFLVKRPDGQVDPIPTAKKFRFAPLPRTLKLKFYSMQPPANWPDMNPPKGEEDHPVRFVTYNDAEAFAEWAGMHLPSEFEWEWAARGPRGYIFPWGNDWPQNELYANWGGKITDSQYMPTTLPVASRDGANPKGDQGSSVPLDGDGRSWCGCHHMVGNVAEWTSSWFEPYAGNKFRDNFMGRWVKIIRGGGAGDGEMLVLRPACRNYVGAGPDAPPYPENSFEWVGFRLASYMKSGRDQLGPIVRRATRAKQIGEDRLAQDRFVGTVTRNWVEPGAVPENHVYVLGRSRSIVLVPQTALLYPDGLEEMVRSWKRPAGFKTERSLAKKSETDHPFFTLAVFHTDIRLDNVQVTKPPEPEPDDKKGKAKRRERGRAKAPETIKGVCPPGTYLLGIWFGKLTVLSPTKEFVCFLPLVEKQRTHFDVKKVKPEDMQPATLKVDAALDWADMSFDIPLGGSGVDDDTRVLVTTRLMFEVGGLEAAGTWIQEDPAAELTARLRAEFDKAESEHKPEKKADDAEKKAASKDK